MFPHEICHLHFPNLAERHAWMEEGMAAYDAGVGSFDASAPEAWLVEALERSR